MAAPRITIVGIGVACSCKPCQLRTRAIPLGAAATSDLLHLPVNADLAARPARGARFEGDVNGDHGVEIRDALQAG